MLVAKFPGSTYATAAMKAGPRKGRTARTPRRSPVSERSAALRTRSPPGSARSPPTTTGCALTALTTSANERRPRQAERHTLAATLEPDLDRTLELARGDDGEAGAGRQAA